MTCATLGRCVASGPICSQRFCDNAREGMARVAGAYLCASRALTTSLAARSPAKIAPATCPE